MQIYGREQEGRVRQFEVLKLLFKSIADNGALAHLFFSVSVSATK